MILSLEKEYAKCLAEGLRVLRSGGLIVFPTDTVYGLGGDARSADVLEKIYALKGRERGKPLSVVMSGLDMIREWCEVSDREANLLSEYLPGAYTFIIRLKKGKTLAGITRDAGPETGKIGVRVPHHFFLRKLALDFGAPLIATSANLSGKGDAVGLGEVEKALVEKADLCIDGGKTQFGKPSTVVDLETGKVLRQGAGEFK